MTPHWLLALPSEAYAWVGLMAVVGLCVGSFVTVVSTRLPKRLLAQASGQTPPAQPLRSHCPHCQQQLRWTDLVPVVSWLMLRARCRHCEHPIAARYPATELLTATWFAWCALVYVSPSVYGGASAMLDAQASALLWALWGAMLLCCLIIDQHYFLLPDVITYPLLAIGVLASALGLTAVDLNASLLGAVSAWLGLWLVALGYRLAAHQDGMGQGDMKLFAAIGAWLGLAALPWVLLGASLSATLVALLLRWRQTRHSSATRGSVDTHTRELLAIDERAIAFGPYLVVSAVGYQVWLMSAAL